MLKQLFAKIRKYTFAIFACAVCAVTAVMFSLVNKGNQQAITAAAQPAQPVFVVDAGHGGPDGGAVGADGTLEKDINLAIAVRVRDFLRAFGCEVVMTREDDRSIHSSDAKTIRQQKVSDIHNRTDLVNDTKGAVLVSIHQNKFPAAAEKGTQVFYSPNNPQSRALALKIQERVTKLLQPENTRKTKPAGNNIYILTYAKAPAVMVECGFISNPGERDKLKSAEYQGKIAFAIADAVLEAAQLTINN
ncbi:MAG: N-acetylmuramoyl-L-alanine amidase [Oscillospiraceae bacterium]|jgi:N-acetylmuramoyl-L-alanine amidase|nr:N-acetylmuramoyl-L-alanine amidase [Oscillospiraceae bacterium]